MNANAINAEIDYIVQQIIEKYQPLKIILFGSASRGEYDYINDLDFLIIKDHVPDRAIDRMLELERLIDRNIAADILVYRSDEIDQRLQLGDPFIETILEEGKVLYG
jgi:predicted nucleotidyltransferase